MLRDEGRKRDAKMCKSISNWSRFDINKNGDMTFEEVTLAKELLEMELGEEKAHAQKKMSWVALISLITYPLIVLLPMIPDSRLDAIVAMSGTLLLALASIVAFYFGATAYMNSKGR